MTVLIDTSVWIDLFRDSTGTIQKSVSSVVGDDDVVLSRFHQLELLQGSIDESEWALLSDYLEVQDYLEASTATWRNAARIYYDLRRQGHTLRSTIDCCIAQLAIEHRILLLHRDQDFERIADIRPLVQRRT
ncbi:MAG: PIN domain-containing protein [Gammaproteobacteria bacterium]|nr:PIN domain-containing protein [Gammaproteobacteria bacterium]